MARKSAGKFWDYPAFNVKISDEILTKRPFGQILLMQNLGLWYTNILMEDPTKKPEQVIPKEKLDLFFNIIRNLAINFVSWYVDELF